MNKALSSLCAIGMAVIPIFAHHGPINEDHDRTSAIKPEVLRANQGSESDRRILADLTAKAVDAVYNKGDRELMNKYFHPKFQLFLFCKGNKHTCEDLLSFYKFKDGWRIVSETSFHVGLD